MLYNNIITILDISRDRNVDIGVAEEMAVNDDTYNAESLRLAGDFIRKYYNAITKCRVAKDNATIERLCELYVNDENAFKLLIEELTESDE